MAGYIYRDFPVPSLSESFYVTVTGALLGSWNAVNPIAVPAESPWFVVPMLRLSSLTEARSDWGQWWDHTLSLQFANAAGSVAYTVPLGMFLTHGAQYCSIEGGAPNTFAATIEKVRIAISSTRFWSATAATVAAAVGAGKLRLYTWATEPEDFAMDCEAQKTAQDLAVIEPAILGAATRLRYRVEQLIEGSMNWTGTPVGTSLRRFT